jgi:photosystem II stability/assembly factor-like uncharacterized protein
VHRSVDGGATWTRASEGIAAGYDGTFNATQLAIGPAHPGTLYAGTVGGTYRSQDRAATWTRIDSEFVRSFLGTQATLVVDGNGWIYLGTRGIRRSRDGGATWTDLGEGLQRGPTGTIEDVSAIVFDPNVAGTIYTIQNSRIYWTTDAGGSWQLQPEMSPVGYYGLALPRGRSGRIFASGWNAVFRSDEGIGRWRPLDLAMYRAAFVIDP